MNSKTPQPDIAQRLACSKLAGSAFLDNHILKTPTRHNAPPTSLSNQINAKPEVTMSWLGLDGASGAFAAGVPYMMVVIRWIIPPIIGFVVLYSGRNAFNTVMALFGL